MSSAAAPQELSIDIIRARLEVANGKKFVRELGDIFRQLKAGSSRDQAVRVAWDFFKKKLSSWLGGTPEQVGQFMTGEHAKADRDALADTLNEFVTQFAGENFDREAILEFFNTVFELQNPTTPSPERASVVRDRLSSAEPDFFFTWVAQIFDRGPNDQVVPIENRRGLIELAWQRIQQLFPHWFSGTRLSELLASNQAADRKIIPLELMHQTQLFFIQHMRDYRAQMSSIEEFYAQLVGILNESVVMEDPDADLRAKIDQAKAGTSQTLMPDMSKQFAKIVENMRTVDDEALRKLFEGLIAQFETKVRVIESTQRQLLFETFATQARASQEDAIRQLHQALLELEKFSALATDATARSGDASTDAKIVESTAAPENLLHNFHNLQELRAHFDGLMMSAVAESDALGLLAKYPRVFRRMRIATETITSAQKTGALPTRETVRSDDPLPDIFAQSLTDTDGGWEIGNGACTCGAPKSASSPYCPNCGQLRSGDSIIIDTNYLEQVWPTYALETVLNEALTNSQEITSRDELLAAAKVGDKTVIARILRMPWGIYGEAWKEIVRIIVQELEDDNHEIKANMWAKKASLGSSGASITRIEGNLTYLGDASGYSRIDTAGTVILQAGELHILGGPRAGELILGKGANLYVESAFIDDLEMISIKMAEGSKVVIEQLSARSPKQEFKGGDKPKWSTISSEEFELEKAKMAKSFVVQG